VLQDERPRRHAEGAQLDEQHLGPVQAREIAVGVGQHRRSIAPGG
jgi:hypothetical protein